MLEIFNRPLVHSLFASQKDLILWLFICPWLGVFGFSPVFAQVQDQNQALPPNFVQAASKAGVPLDAFGLLLLPATPNTLEAPAAAPSLAWQENHPMLPASLMKLPTSLAALELLGPDFAWTTPVFADGPIADGTLQGSLYIQGSGDPKLWLQHIWLLLRQLRSLDVTQITGDLVLDQSIFGDLGATDPAAFDGHGLRPYNTLPQALLLNFNALSLYFYPDIGAGVARVRMDPLLFGVDLQSRIPLSKKTCDREWRSALALKLSQGSIRFNGQFPSTCGNKTWTLAHPDPDYFAAALLQALWQELGGSIGGQVRITKVPPKARILFEYRSPPLAEVLRDVNKFSNNLMARQLFLSLGLQGDAASTSLEAAQARFRKWWQDAFPNLPMPLIANGSGLSLESRITPKALMGVLQRAWNGPFMPEFFASLPILGLDGTLRSYNTCKACAHLKSGSLPRSGVYGLAGYVHGKSGQDYLFVALSNHPKAIQARPAFEALIDWLALH